MLKTIGELIGCVLSFSAIAGPIIGFALWFGGFFDDRDLGFGLGMLIGMCIWGPIFNFLIGWWGVSGGYYDDSE